MLVSKPLLTSGSIKISGLAERILVFGGGIADVVTTLSTTDEALVCVYLVRLWNGSQACQKIYLKKSESGRRTRALGDAKCFEARGVGGKVPVT